MLLTADLLSVLIASFNHVLIFFNLSILLKPFYHDIFTEAFSVVEVFDFFL